jgi:anti-sigma regulatory factor (Ser/Thr protein kinase)
MDLEKHPHPPMEGFVKLHIGAYPEYLCIARVVLRKCCEIAGMVEHDIDSVTLALDEALTNVIRHSYGGPCEKPIIIEMKKTGVADEKSAKMEITIRDFGKQVDPASIKSRDLDDIRPGGLGVHIIRSVMDEVQYAQAVGAGMQLRMVKKFSPVEISADLCGKTGSSGGRDKRDDWRSPKKQVADS